MNYSFIYSSTFADSLQKVFKASTLNLITFITPSLQWLSDSAEDLTSVLNLFKSSLYSHNQFLSGVNWGGVHDTLHMPPKKKKSRGVKSGDRAGHANQGRPFSMDDCKQLLA
jgi:hypothetical protein